MNGKYLPGSAVLFSVMLVCSMVLVTLSASAFSVVHERMLEEKALARLRIEECLDVAEHMYNTKNGEKLSFFNGCSFLWSEEAVAVQYEDMERTFPVEWVPSFVVNASSTFSMDYGSRLLGDVAAEKFYFYGSSKLLSCGRPCWTESLWQPAIDEGNMYVSSTRRTIVFVGWRGMKTTYEKDSFYYAGEGTKTGAPGYEYSNLMFQTGSHCYYTSYDHCVEGKGIKITQFDDGMKQLLPSVVLWKRIPEAKPVEQFQKIYNCTGSAIVVGDGKALTLQTSTLTLVYEQDLKVISGTQTATVPFLNSLFQECNVEVGSGYYGELLLGAKNVAVKDSQINHLNVQSEKYITVNGSNLDNVTLSGEEVELSSSQFSGQISAKVVRAKGSSILRRALQNEGSPPLLVRIIH